jgi:hypothetical protein
VRGEIVIPTYMIHFKDSQRLERCSEMVTPNGFEADISLMCARGAVSQFAMFGVTLRSLPKENTLLLYRPRLAPIVSVVEERVALKKFFQKKQSRTSGILDHLQVLHIFGVECPKCKLWMRVEPITLPLDHGLLERSTHVFRNRETRAMMKLMDTTSPNDVAFLSIPGMICEAVVVSSIGEARTEAVEIQFLQVRRQHELEQRFVFLTEKLIEYYRNHDVHTHGISLHYFARCGEKYVETTFFASRSQFEAFASTSYHLEQFTEAQILRDQRSQYTLLGDSERFVFFMNL